MDGEARGEYAKWSTEGERGLAGQCLNFAMGSRAGWRLYGSTPGPLGGTRNESPRIELLTLVEDGLNARVLVVGGGVIVAGGGAVVSATGEHVVCEGARATAGSASE